MKAAFTCSRQPAGSLPTSGTSCQGLPQNHRKVPLLLDLALALEIRSVIRIEIAWWHGAHADGAMLSLFEQLLHDAVILLAPLQPIVIIGPDVMAVGRASMLGGIRVGARWMVVRRAVALGVSAFDAA